MPEDSAQFSAAPKVVKPKNKYKQKEPEEQQEDQIKLIYNNLMWDKRVFRGNTYSALVTSKNVQIPHGNTTTKQPKMMRQQEQEEGEQMGSRRANIQIFTDDYVETLTDKPPRYEYGAQTQFKMEKQVVRHRIPVKTGIDLETQIWDNELFDFDYEVDPLLSVLVARTLEISRMEVLQEQQLSIMKNRQQQLHLQEDLERKKIQKMYQIQEQLQKENEKRLQAFKKEKQKKAKTHQKLFSRVLAKQYLRDVKQNTLSHVQGQGFFRNPIDADLIEKLLPKFYSESLKEESILNQWKVQAEELINATKDMMIKENAEAKEKQSLRRKKIIQKRQQEARQKMERSLMKAQLKYMQNFLKEQQQQKQRLEEEERKKAEEAQNGQQPQP